MSRFKFVIIINLTKTPPPLMDGLINVTFSNRFNNKTKKVKINKNRGKPIFFL